jgi:hypothetical protein
MDAIFTCSSHGARHFCGVCMSGFDNGMASYVPTIMHSQSNIARMDRKVFLEDSVIRSWSLSAHVQDYETRSLGGKAGAPPNLT